MIKIKDPWIIDNFFSEEKYNEILKSINIINKKDWEFVQEFNRYQYQSEYLNRISLLELNRARTEFESKTLLPTYSLLSLYNMDSSNLEKHKDNNACTYTFDICLYEDTPWSIFVEGKEYILKNNQALCFYGENQLHWRPPFISGNKVLMLFMHWAEPEHIYFQNNFLGVDK